SDFTPRLAEDSGGATLCKCVPSSSPGHQRRFLQTPSAKSLPCRDWLQSSHCPGRLTFGCYPSRIQGPEFSTLRGLRVSKSRELHQPCRFRRKERVKTSDPPFRPD